MRTLWIAVLCSGLALLSGCSENFGNPAAPYAPPPAGPLLSPSQLSEGIYNWPSTEFTETDFAIIQLFRDVGDVAIDFTLEDLSGREHTLSDLLAEKPVLLLIGSYTCPVYQDAVAELRTFADEEFEAGKSFGDRIQFVHVYVTEAHPQSPDVAPHFGGVTEDVYSTVPQARTYGKRKENAEKLAPAIGPGQLLLIDDLRPHGPDNPIWSSYGSGAASAWFIRQDGTIVAAQEWIDMRTLKKAARLSLLATDG